MPEKSVLVFCAVGTEEIECLTAVDVFRRCGFRTVLCSCGAGTSPKSPVAFSHSVSISADCHISEVSAETEWDAIVIPGGMPGAKNISEDASAKKVTVQAHKNGKLIAAICAAPAVVLDSWGLLPDKATCYPSFAETLGKKYVEEKVVVSGNVVTSAGPGTAMAFAFKVAGLLDAGTAKKRAKGMLVDDI